MDKKTLADLASPFEYGDVKFRIQSMTQDQKKALVLPYLDSRAIMDRLDSVLGPLGWRDKYVEWQNPTVSLNSTDAAQAGFDAYKNLPDSKNTAKFVKDYYRKGVKCILSIKDGKEWISKEDGASNTDIEGIKGGFSTALRRAAVKFGLGRYLYNIPDLWIPITINRQDGMESVYYKGSYRYYTKPSLEQFAPTTPKVQSAATVLKPSKPVQHQASQPVQAQPAQPAQPVQGAQPTQAAQPAPVQGAPNPAVSTAEFRDWQTRLAPLAQGSPNAQEMIAQSNAAPDSMGKVSKLLGACWALMTPGANERATIESAMEDKKLPDMVLVLKNSLMVLETKK